MKNVSKYKVELNVLIPILIFFIVSIISIYSTKRLLPIEYHNLWLKQIIWYIIVQCSISKMIIKRLRI